MNFEGSHHTFSDTVLEYHSNGVFAPGFLIRPQAVPVARHREFLPGDAPELHGLPKKWHPFPATSVDPLVHLHLASDNPVGHFAQGRTMRSGSGTQELRFLRQDFSRSHGGSLIETHLTHPSGVECIHSVFVRDGESVFRVSTTLHNCTTAPVAVEMLTSFSMGGLSPFCEDDAAGRLVTHRFRSAWSAEGRLESRSVEDLHLERSWSGHSILSERFGQVGSLPVRGFFPFLALEDTQAGVTWGAELACPGSWQMEFSRQGDFLSLSGGQADKEFGHWWKVIAPGEAWTTPEAHLACVCGGIEDLCHRMVDARNLNHLPPMETELPVVVNEWCSSWGNPTHENLVQLAERLEGTPARYLVIDDGWAERPADGIQQNGDWMIDRGKFPHGLASTCEAIRSKGLIPGIWFEFEVCNEGARAFSLTDHQLQRNGRVLQVGNRRFWDFRDEWTHGYLREKVIRLLQQNRIGYLKIDYNETIGLGVDGAESTGEGLRQHLEGVQTFLRSILRECPGLVLESCSSGGHRLEPSFLALSSMGSFSDAHETVEIPVIAANLQRLLPPRQSQIWAVLRSGDSPDRLAYSLAATFLGRMCLSGELTQLSAESWRATQEAMTLYGQAASILRDGRSRLFSHHSASWRHLTGWQAVWRETSTHALLVAHSFAKSPRSAISLPIPGASAWLATESWPRSQNTFLSARRDAVEFTFDHDFQGQVVLFQKASKP